MVVGLGRSNERYPCHLTTTHNPIPQQPTQVFIKGAAHPEEVSLYFALSFSTSHGGTFLAFLLSPLVTAAAPMYVAVLSCMWPAGSIRVAGRLID